MLDSLITSKTRLKLLVKFFSNPQNVGHLRGLADEFGESTNAVRKELNHLSEAGLLVKVAEKNKIDYKANYQHPLFSNLQQLIHNYLGFDKLLSAVLERMGEVDMVALHGDYSKGFDSGLVEVIIQGQCLDVDYLDTLSEKIEAHIQKKVCFKISDPSKDTEGLLVLYKK